MKKCPICESFHEEWQAHVFAEQKEDVRRQRAVKELPEVSEQSSEVGEEALRKRAWREKNRSSYNEYMKQYMREYRRRK